MFKKKDYIKELKDAKMVCLSQNDNYNRGMYNGIEYVLALMEDREPEYLLEDVESTRELKVTKRTMAGVVKK